MSKKTDRRLDHKRERAAERRVLQGGPTQTVHGPHWNSPTVVIANDDETRYPKKKGKHPPKKERCPVNGRHECLTEEREVEEGLWITKTVTRKFKLCVHCGKEWVYRHRVHSAFKWAHNKTGWKTVNPGR
jgi:hypothetical protein